MFARSESVEAVKFAPAVESSARGGVDAARSSKPVRSSKPAPVGLLSRLHRDQRGAVSLETILIVAAIALPILIFILKFGWPKIRDYFNTGTASSR